MAKEIKMSLEPVTPEIEEAVTPPEDPVLALLLEIKSILNSQLGILSMRYEDVEDYLYIEESVINTSPKEYYITELLGRVSKSGYIRNDGTADIYVSINGREPIKLEKAEQLNWGPYAHRLIIDKMKVTTTSSSSQSFRLLAL